MSFFVSYPISNALPGPDKSGHRAPYGIIVRSALHVCPDLRGTLRPPVKGHETKKGISMLIVQFLSCIIPKLCARVMCESVTKPEQLT